MNKANIIFLFGVFFAITNAVFAIDNPTPQQAIDAEKVGDHKKAMEIYIKLAEKGDVRAMIDVGAKYYNGEGVTQDYKKAMDWWLKGFEAHDPDAPGNIGVLYRDGKGVKQNRKIAYALFLFTHLNSLGTERTQIRVNSLLRRENEELPQKEIEETLCYTWEYVLAYVRAKGELKAIPKDVLPSSGKVRFKDSSLFLDSEKKGMRGCRKFCVNGLEKETQSIRQETYTCPLKTNCLMNCLRSTKTRKTSLVKTAY